MGRANDPPSREASRAVNGIFFIAIIDAILLILSLIWLIFVCNGGAFVSNTDTNLWILHAIPHAFIIISACVVYPLDVLYVPFWFGFIALIVAAIDVFVLVARSQLLFNGNVISLGCDFFLWLFDLVFLLLAIAYLAFAARSVSWYGLFGDSDDASDPFTRQPLLSTPKSNANPLSSVKNDDFLNQISVFDDPAGPSAPQSVSKPYEYSNNEDAGEHETLDKTLYFFHTQSENERKKALAQKIASKNN